MRLESYVLDVMDGKRSGRSFLRILSYLYRTGVALRNFGYDTKILPAIAVDIPVISIGNIVAGGTGKTPLVKYLACELSLDFSVAILSRGYRSEVEKTGEIVRVEEGETAKRCGDEPCWLAKEVPTAAVWVGKNRSISATLAIAAGAQVIILDDGMQYRQLRRDVEIVVIDGDDPLGKGFFLPRGLLRDTPLRLKKADLIVVNQAKSHQKVKEQLRKYTDAPVVFVRLRMQTDLKGRRAGIFCAIGRPDRFIQAVRDCGAEVVATYFKPDHDPFNPEEIGAFARRSGADCLVCTEKDHVKIPLEYECQLPIIPLRGDIEIVSGREEWNTIIEAIKSQVKK